MYSAYVDGTLKQVNTLSSEVVFAVCLFVFIMLRVIAHEDIYSMYKMCTLHWRNVHVNTLNETSTHEQMHL